MIDEVLRLATIASSLMASSAFMLALMIAVGGTLERANATCSTCFAGASIRVMAKPPERSPPTIRAAVLQQTVRQ